MQASSQLLHQPAYSVSLGHLSLKLANRFPDVVRRVSENEIHRAVPYLRSEHVETITVKDGVGTARELANFSQRSNSLILWNRCVVLDRMLPFPITPRFSGRQMRKDKPMPENDQQPTVSAPLEPLGTPGMGVILSGESPVCETGSLKEVSIPNDRSDRQSTR